MNPARSFGLFPLLDDTEQRLEFKAASILAIGLGMGGTDWVAGGDGVHSGNWMCFHAVTDCVLASVGYKSGTSTGSPAGLTLKAGDRIYGNIISFSLTTGNGELYRNINV